MDESEIMPDVGVMKNLRIIIVNTQPVPSTGAGAASVNRILSYAKGLANDGNSIRILSTGAGDTGWNDYDGILTKHLGKTHSSILVKGACYLTTVVKLLFALWHEKKDVVLFVTSNYILIIVLQLFCSLTKTKLVNEKSEFPFMLMRGGWYNRVWAKIYLSTAYRMLDGMIIMTNPLMEFYKNYTSSSCKFIEVPMTVDISRFNRVDSGMSSYGNYVAYCGNMGGNKDGLSDLLKAFSIVEKRGCDLNLLLIGGTNTTSEYNELLELNRRLCNKRVIFYGKASRDEIPHLLKNAKILALARPSGMQSTGGFPTKLGEYLATGNPVVVTSVGDIPRYLKHKVNAYIVPPDNINEFAEMLCYVYNNYSEAKNVGERGKAVAETTFNGEFQAKRIQSFLLEILN